MYYSASTGGFYDKQINGKNIPDDAVKITKKQHALLLDGQSNGFSIIPDDNGYPMLYKDSENG